MNPQFIISGALLIGLSYLLGCINFAYYYSTIIKKADIRTLGSSNPGALNTLMVFGKASFAIVLCGDFAKGSLAVFLAMTFSQSQPVILLSATAVVLGHIYPWQLEFRGGKGIAALLGGFSLYNPVWLLTVCVLYFVFFPIVKKFSIAGLIALACLPVFALTNKGTPLELAYLIAIISLIIFRHQTNIQEYLEVRYHKK